MKEITEGAVSTVPDDTKSNTTERFLGTAAIDEKAETIPKVSVATHFFRQRHLYAFATQAEIIHHVRTQASSEEVRRLPEILAGWELLQPRVAALIEHEKGIADNLTLEPIPEEYRPLLDALTSDVLFQKTFLNVPTGFALIEIDKLVAPQRTVNLEYVERLIKQ